MVLIINYQRVKLSGPLIRTISNCLPNTCFDSNRILQANRKLQNVTLRGYSNEVEKSARHRLLTTCLIANRNVVNHDSCKFEFQSRGREYTTQNPGSNIKNESNQEKQTLFQRMKQMMKDYWYILIPVHIATSIVWISVFYTAAKNGVDVEEILKYFNLNEKYLEKIRSLSAGHWALAYALYKLFTPLRYTVTLGGTTMTIRYLNKWGIMKFKTPDKVKDILSSKTVAQTKARFSKTDGKTKTTPDSSKT